MSPHKRGTSTWFFYVCCFFKMILLSKNHIVRGKFCSPPALKLLGSGGRIVGRETHFAIYILPRKHKWKTDKSHISPDKIGGGSDSCHTSPCLPLSFLCPPFSSQLLKLCKTRGDTPWDWLISKVPSSCVHYESVNSNSAVKEEQLAIPNKSGPVFAKGVYTPGKWLKCMSVKCVIPFAI